ncbi:TPA: AAA family ATPase [Listeria innocua]|nr:AAA family ATPase [Listeria innocua]
MKFKINNVEISNLRNIPYDKPLTFELSKQMITILDGPNGYGKTTFFDAIELLITGNLGHFFDGLYNVGKEPLSSVAKDRNKDTTITAQILVKDEGVYTLKRNFTWTPEVSSSIEVISSSGDYLPITTQEELFSFFDITESIFNIGMYISQNDSLQFLKLPYKKRKDAFSAIVGTDKDDSKKEYLGELRKVLLEKQKQLNLKYEQDIQKASIEIQKYDELIIIEAENGQVITYNKIFPEQDYEFDKEIVEITKIQNYLKTLSQIETFLRSEDSFISLKNNKILEKLKAYERNFFAAIYFEEKIQELKSRKDEIEFLKKFDNIKQKFIDNKKYDNDNSLFNSIFKDSIKRINGYVELIGEKEKKLNGINLQKNKLIAARKNLKKVHDEDHFLGSDICPFCGKPELDLISLYDSLSEIIGENESELSKEIHSIREQMTKFIEKEFSDEVDEYITPFRPLLKEYDDYQVLFPINPKNLKEELNSQDLLNMLINSEQLFRDNYIQVIQEIERRMQPVTVNIDKTKEIAFESISQIYFENKKANITTADIQVKKAYLVHVLNNQGKQLKQKQVLIKKNLENKKNLQEEKMKEKITEIESLQSIYSRCIEEYHSDFLKDIKIPLYIISGRIMQTSPIGLGIEAKIDTRKIEFTSGTMTHDVANMLSAGQLNGLMISIMLAVQKTYLSNKGVKLFMIDDPLQSIDDLSAHSFVDLLTQEFNENQVIISTHELEKTVMFYYKYEQAGIPFSRKNLQNEYLE